MSLSHTSKMACSNEYAADLVTQYPNLIMWESFSKLQKYVLIVEFTSVGTKI